MFTTLLEAQVIYHEKKEKERNRFTPGAGGAIGGAAVGGAAATAHQSVKHRVWNKKTMWDTMGLPKGESKPSLKERILGPKNKEVKLMDRHGPIERMKEFPSATDTIEQYDRAKMAARKTGKKAPSRISFVRQYVRGKAQGFFGGPKEGEAALKGIGRGVKAGVGVGLAAGAAMGVRRHQRNKELRKKYA